ncbi:MAG: hypothetical protein QOE93_844 [Actinomycetota bacterium]|nr:hypothetical protein [Actinomycetota bacterium]
MIVRQAVEGDLDRMVELYAAVADEGRWIGAESPVDTVEVRRRWAEALAAGHVHLVADAGELPGVVGQIGIDVAPYGVASIGMLVDADWRRRGVGTALVNAAVDWARDQGCHKVTLQVWPHNQAARALYRSLGFVEEGVLRRHYPRRNGELWDAVVMGLVLDESRPGSSAGTGD